LEIIYLKTYIKKYTTKRNVMRTGVSVSSPFSIDGRGDGSGCHFWLDTKGEKTMLKPILLAGSLICSIAALPAVAETSSATPALKINTAFAMPLSSEAQDGIFDRLMQAVFKRLNKTVVVQHPPAERALRYANAGIDDGDGPRIAGLDKLYSNLIQVPEKTIDVDFVAFTKGDLTFDSTDWDSLKPYDVGIVKGWKILEKNIQETQSRVSAKDPTHLFEMLRDDRIQVAVIGRMTGLYTAREINLAVNVMEPPFASREMFLYLNKKHADLVQPVSDALKALKDEGLYAEIMKF
jgi:polar amino acid transport system substrate-binding protein